MPQVIVNKEKWKEAIEGLETSRELAKQGLSQLSGQYLVRADHSNQSEVGSRSLAGLRAILGSFATSQGFEVCFNRAPDTL
jgi:hypothetical protein